MKYPETDGELMSIEGDDWNKSHTNGSSEPKISYRTQVLLHIYKFQKENNRGISISELSSISGLKDRIISKSHDSLMDIGIIDEKNAIIDNNHITVLVITPQSMDFVADVYEDLKDKIGGN